MYLLGWYISEISSLIPHVPLLCFVVTISSASPFVQNGMLWGKGSFWESAWVLERTSSCSTLDTWSLMFTCVVDFGSAVDLGGWHVQECLGPWFQPWRILYDTEWWSFKWQLRPSSCPFLLGHVLFLFICILIPSKDSTFKQQVLLGKKRAFMGWTSL